jgi:16S rRNA processing protein RimM
MSLIKLAEITKPVGLKGQVRAYSLTDFPTLRFKKGTVLTLTDLNGATTAVTVNYFRDEGQFVVLGFNEWPSIEEAEKHLHASLFLDSKEAPLPKGYYRLEDLKGCAILDETGKELGLVSDVLSYAPTKTLRVHRDGAPDFFVPFLLNEFILSIDIDHKRITIKVMPGLL